ncbi:MAG: hypothetical protein M5U25_09515 [Planctomycetota bacterium]|nr:hypothetical protein [Planctomycetota bacterium]
MKIIAATASVLVLALATSACRHQADTNRPAVPVDKSNVTATSNALPREGNTDESANAGNDSQSTSKEVWIHVDGMTKVQGIT